MTKRNNIIYWIATVWLSLGMVVTGIFQIIQLPEGVKVMAALGYLPYFMTIIGVWKILGVIAILIPKRPLLKEWAYAGFFFVATGAVFSHLAMGDPASELFGPCLLIVLTAVSWYFRPASRKINSTTNSISDNKPLHA